MNFPSFVTKKTRSFTALINPVALLLYTKYPFPVVMPEMVDGYLGLFGRPLFFVTFNSAGFGAKLGLESTPGTITGHPYAPA